MPPCHEVRSLSSITEEYLCCSFLNTCDDDVDVLMKKRCFLESSLNENITQQILNNTLNGLYDLDVIGVIAILELFGGPKTKNIDLSICGQVPADNLARLCGTILKLSSPETKTVNLSCYIKALSQAKQMFDSSVILISAVRNMRNLSKLVLQGVGDTELLTIIGNSCHQLKHLDVSDSPFVEDASLVTLVVKEPEDIVNTTVPELIKYNGAMNPLAATLTYLGVSGTNIGYPGIILSLHAMPKLESFGGHMPSGSVSKSIFSIYLCDLTRKFQITEIWDYCISEMQSKCLSVACPNLTSINTNAHSLYALHDAPCLEHFTVKCDYNDMDNFICSYLQHKGHQLKTLQIKQLTSSLLDLELISHSCPLITELKAPLKWTPGTGIRTWQALESADITVSSLLCLEKFIASSPNLKSLQLSFKTSGSHGDDELQLDADSTIGKLLKSGDLRKLESLCLHKCNISIGGLNGIIDHCPSLTYLGKLGDWPNIDETSLQMLKQRVTAANWSIVLDL